MNDRETTAQPTSKSIDSTGSWILDPDLSSVTFAHKTLWGMATVNGTFGQLAGKGEGTGSDGTVSGTLAIRAASVDTNHRRRDGHLRSSMFLDAEKFPALTFEADHVESGTDATARIAGRLTVKDHTTDLAFTANSVVVDPDTLRLTATVDVDRTEFGITTNQLGMIKGPATVSVDLLFRRRLD
jgi:polyisoprenoid-binding protein YceI